MLRRILCCWTPFLMLAGCAAPVPPALHTRWAAEVVATAPDDTAGGGLEHEGAFEPFPEELGPYCGIGSAGAGVTTLALLRFSYYWHNGGAPVRQDLRWYPVTPGLGVATGALVAAEALPGRAGPDSRCPWVVEVLADGIDGAGCRYAHASSGTEVLSTVLYGMIGPPGSASLDCPELEAGGWQKRPFGLYGAWVLTRMP